MFIVNVPIDPHELKQRETNFVEPILLKFSCITNVFWRLRQETVNNKKKNYIAYIAASKTVQKKSLVILSIQSLFDVVKEGSCVLYVVRVL